MTDIIRIDAYKAEIENNAIVYYAVAGKKRYKMPDAFKSMYNEDYLRIRKVTTEFPELFGLSETETSYYIPIMTEGLI